MGQYSLHQWLSVDHLGDTARNVPGQEIEPLIDIIINEVERFLLSSKEQVCHSRALNGEKITLIGHRSIVKAQIISITFNLKLD